MASAVRCTPYVLLVFAKEFFSRPDKGESTIEPDEFMAATLSVWEIPPESAKRVGHPAPFPLELASIIWTASQVDISLYVWDQASLLHSLHEILLSQLTDELSALLDDDSLLNFAEMCCRWKAPASSPLNPQNFN